MEWYDVLLTLKEAPDYRLRLSELADQVLLSRSNLTRLVVWKKPVLSTSLVERSPGTLRGIAYPHPG